MGQAFVNIRKMVKELWSLSDDIFISEPGI